jgi:hypothetical protein
VVAASSKSVCFAIDRAPDELRVLERHARLDGVGAGTEAPERLDDRVGKIPIAAPQDIRPLLCALLGKGVRDIRRGTVTTPAHDVKHDEIRQITESIEDRQRDVRQGLEEEPHQDSRESPCWQCVDAVDGTRL